MLILKKTKWLSKALAWSIEYGFLISYIELYDPGDLENQVKVMKILSPNEVYVRVWLNTVQ